MMRDKLKQINKIMEKYLFDVPISFHIFNRPETTKKVFEEIRKIKPKQLFITADGARESRPRDTEDCIATRSIINKIDWECEVHTNFSDVNKGSFKSTSEGITWVFKHVDRAIILEDDCVPHESFFEYCRELLEYYEHDTRIGLISGNNFQTQKDKTEDSYFFSRYTLIWGWATWKRTWQQVDFSMKNWPEYNRINGLKGSFSNKKEIQYWGGMYQDMFDKKRKLHWDYLLSLSSFMNNTLTIIPNVNLVSNIGYGPDASNCKAKSKFHCLENEEIKFPLKHPNFICRFVTADDYVELNLFSGLYRKWKAVIRPLTPYILITLYRAIKRKL
jgi:hypothetical protein